MNTKEIKYIAAKEAAKTMKKEMQAAFPGVKFSVTTQPRGTIYVYFSGPTENRSAITEIGNKYEGASFDGSIDLESYITQMVDGVEVQYGTKYVICQPGYFAA
jgi:hypothetical protein